MSDEWKSMIEFLTGWIIIAFLIFVPKWTGARMGTALLDRRISPMEPPPLTSFSPTSEILFPFSFLTTDYRLPTTDYCLSGDSPQKRTLLSSPDKVLSAPDEL